MRKLIAVIAVAVVSTPVVLSAQTYRAPMPPASAYRASPGGQTATNNAGNQQQLRAAQQQLQQAQGQLQAAQAYQRALQRQLYLQRRYGYNPRVLGYAPVVTWLPSGATLNASGVVSPDGRHVRVNAQPFFSSVGPVYTFNPVTGQYIRVR